MVLQELLRVNQIGTMAKLAELDECSLEYCVEFFIVFSKSFDDGPELFIAQQCPLVRQVVVVRGGEEFLVIVVVESWKD